MKLPGIRRLFGSLGLLSAAAAAMLMSSCESIYDNEGDCTTTYEIAITHKMNLLGADAFDARVNSVWLYVFDRSTGTCVLTKRASGSELTADRQTGTYTMRLTSDEIAPGRYDLIAWGGLEGNGTYRLDCGDGRPATKSDLICRLTAAGSDGVCASQLGDLFHGKAENVEFPAVYGEQRITANIDLTKNTNTVRVVLQHYNGRPLKGADFHFTVADNNGVMNHDNGLLAGDVITYREWSKNEGLVERPDAVAARADEGIASISSVVAEFSLGRLVTQGHNPYLRIDVEGKVDSSGKSVPVVNMPLYDLLLIAKGENNRNMDNQEFLDRQDDYNLFFYLDDAYGWYTQMGVWVNSWHVIFQDKEL